MGGGMHYGIGWVSCEWITVASNYCLTQIGCWMLDMVLIDEENRRYFKQQEITVFRIP